MSSRHFDEETYTDNTHLESTEKFDHDTDTLLIQAKIAKEAASVLKKQLKKIKKKQQQTTSKKLPKCIEKYNTSLKEIRDAINRMQDALSEGGFTDMAPEGRNKLTRSISLPKTERGRLQEQTDTAHATLPANTSQRECLMCMKNETKIKELEDKLKSLQQNAKEYDELLRKYQDERDKSEKYQRLYNEERKGTEDARQSLQQNAKEYEELLQNYQDERDQSEKYQRLYKEEREGKENVLQSLQQNAKEYEELLQKYQDEREQSEKYQRLYKEEREGKEHALQSLQQNAKEYEELLRKYQDEREQSEKYQRLYNEEREGKEDARQSTEKFDLDTDTLDTLLIQAKIAKEAASVLRKTQKKIERRQQQTTSKTLPRLIEKYKICLEEIREAVNRMQDALSEGGFTDMTREGRNKLTHSESLLKKGRGRFQEQTDTKRVSLTESTHLKECMMYMKNEKKRKALEDKLKSLQQNADEYEELLRKYQDERDQHAKYQRLYKEEREGKKDALQRLSAVASSKLRDNNPNIADLSDQNRPTKIAEKMSELYDNQWTDAYGVLQDRGFEEKQIIKTLLDMFMVAYNECSKLASENFFERVQRCIEIPAEEFLLPANYNVVMPDQLKQQVKEFRKAQARHVVKELEMIVRKRINSENQGVDAVYVYLSHCIEIAWYCAVQDPPVVVRRDAPVNFDKNAYKEYTSRGRYTAFVVWPAMYLYDGGALLLKGVAQGSNTRAYGSKTAAASGEIASARNQYKSPSVAYRTTDAKSQTVTMKSSTLDSKRDGAVDHRTNEARINMKPGTRQQQYNARMVFYTDNRTRPGNQTYFVTDI